MTVVAIPIDFEGGRLEIEAAPGDMVMLRQIGRHGRPLFQVWLGPTDAREVARLLRLAADAAESRSSEFYQEPEESRGRWGPEPADSFGERIRRGSG